MFITLRSFHSTWVKFIISFMMILGDPTDRHLTRKHTMICRKRYWKEESLLQLDAGMMVMALDTKRLYQHKVYHLTLPLSRPWLPPVQIQVANSPAACTPVPLLGLVVMPFLTRL